MSLRIAVWHNLPSGGGKRQLYNHVKGLLERGHHVESWCPDSADQKFLPLNELIKETIIPFENRHNYFYETYRTAQRIKVMIHEMELHCQKCAEQISSGGFDILYANACLFFRTAPIAQYVNLPTAIYLGEPYRWFYESMPELPWIAPEGGIPKIRLNLNSIRQYILKRASLNGIRIQARAELGWARAFDRILVNSIYSRESVLRAYNLDSSVCYLGIDTDYYQPTGEKKENIVVGLGTIYHAKGVDRAIRAVGAIHESKRPELVWIGNGLAELYEPLAKELKVTYTTKVHIRDDEVKSLLSRASTMVYTSRLEPFGLAPLEANACGTFVVGIAEGGVRESMTEGVNGYMAREDDPEELGRLILKVIESPQKAVDLGIQAREHVLKEWSMEKGTDNIEALLRKLISQGK